MLLYNSTAIFNSAVQTLFRRFNNFQNIILYSRKISATKKHTMKTTLRTLASLFVLCCLTAGAYAINPLKEYTYTPKDLGLEYSEDSVMTSDGYRIHIWNLPG